MSLGTGRGSTSDWRTISETAGKMVLQTDLASGLRRHLAVSSLALESNRDWGGGIALQMSNTSRSRWNHHMLVLSCYAEPNVETGWTERVSCSPGLDGANSLGTVKVSVNSLCVCLLLCVAFPETACPSLGELSKLRLAVSRCLVFPFHL